MKKENTLAISTKKSDTQGSSYWLSKENITQVHRRVISWFEHNKRELPWRWPFVDSQENPAWAIMVSEIMLQQTPVVRVLPRWHAWMEKWPQPELLAQAATSEVLKAWQSLGYPRRALRLQETAQTLTDFHNGNVPEDYATLLTLPGIGDYTAAAISTFAYKNKEVVVDTNVRRVEARCFSGKALPNPSYTAAEKQLAETVLPHDLTVAVEWNAAVMELGALVCTAKNPACDQCPLFSNCAWIAAGKPEADYTPKGQAWKGTNRQARGTIMAVLRAQDSPIHVTELRENQKISEMEASRVETALDGLVSDGLAVMEYDYIQLPR